MAVVHLVPDDQVIRTGLTQIKGHLDHGIEAVRKAIGALSVGSIGGTNGQHLTAD